MLVNFILFIDHIEVEYSNRLIRHDPVILYLITRLWNLQGYEPHHFHCNRNAIRKWEKKIHIISYKTCLRVKVIKSSHCENKVTPTYKHVLLLAPHSLRMIRKQSLHEESKQANDGIFQSQHNPLAFFGRHVDGDLTRFPHQVTQTLTFIITLLQPRRTITCHILAPSFPY